MDTITRAERYGGVGSQLQLVNRIITTKGARVITYRVVNNIIDVNDEFQITITPRSSNSWFLIEARWFGEVTAAHDIVFNIVRDGVQVNNTANNFYTGLTMPTTSYPAADNNSTPESINITTLDTTGSTKGLDTTFRLMVGARATRTLYTNRTIGHSTGTDSYEIGVSEITVTEFKG